MGTVYLSDKSESILTDLVGRKTTITNKRVKLKDILDEVFEGVKLSLDSEGNIEFTLRKNNGRS